MGRNADSDLPVEMEKEADDRGRIYTSNKFAGQTLRVRIEDAVDPTDLPVYFARYKVALSVAGKAAMLSEGRVGYDWGTGPFDAASDYDAHGKGAREDRDALVDLAENMGLVVAAAEQTAPDRVKIGPVAQQPIETRAYEHVDRDKDDDIDPDGALSPAANADNPEDPRINHEVLTQKPDTPRVYMKTVQMAPRLTVTVTEDDAPQLFEQNSRPRNTLRRWHSKADAVREAYRNATYPNPYED
jgi:hypothetical protein